MSGEVEGVEVTHADKELFPAGDRGAAVTKEGLARYYADMAAVMLPHLRERPVNMQRFPDGIEGPGFYEKKVPSHFPDWVATVEVVTAERRQRQVVVDDVRTLVYLAQQACLTPHTWLSRVGDLDRPDQLVFDLDPSVEGLAEVRRATRLVGEILDELGLTSYLKTTGSRGYHVLVPLRPEEGFDEVRDFARSSSEGSRSKTSWSGSSRAFVVHSQVCGVRQACWARYTRVRRSSTTTWRWVPSSVCTSTVCTQSGKCDGTFFS